MQQNNVESNEQALVGLPTSQGRSIEIPGTLPVRLHRLDLARHVAIAPDDKRYVVATYNDTHMGRGYITTAMPQQNEYLTLIRLAVCQISSDTPEEAVQRHIALVQAIQQGRLHEFLQSLPQMPKA